MINHQSWGDAIRDGASVRGRATFLKAVRVETVLPFGDRPIVVKDVTPGRRVADTHAFKLLGAHFGHREHLDRSIVNAQIGHRERSEATLAGLRGSSLPSFPRGSLSTTGRGSGEGGCTRLLVIGLRGRLTTCPGGPLGAPRRGLGARLRRL